MFGLKNKNKPEDKPGMFGRLRLGLRKTRDLLFSDLDDLIKGGPEIGTETLDEIETRLLMADLGVESTMYIMDGIKTAIKRNKLNNMEQLLLVLRQQMLAILTPVQMELKISTDQHKPFIILVVGVNGAGKTTTIGKLTNYFSKQNYSVMLAAGDTFRAAAIEQIQAWGNKTKTPVIAQQIGSDSAAVIYDAIQSARAKNIDIVIADTAGRLHNKDNLMQELSKIRRTITKLDPDMPVEAMLVLDAGTGQNALAQAKQFTELIGITGITLTKLDGTAKGGVIFALARALAIPIRFIGIGEQLDDLRPFAADLFVDALLEAEK